MCITFFRLGSKNKNSAFPFVLVFNRDEYTYRLSESAKFQVDQGMSNIICGIDIQTNSTWLAFNKLTGNVCFLTNFRNPKNHLPNKKFVSRGFLVLDFAKINDPTIANKNFDSVEDYERNMRTMVTRGFNLVYGNVHTMKFKYFQYQNMDNKEMTEPLQLVNNQVYGMSNGYLNEWDKVQRGKVLFEDVCTMADDKYAQLDLPNDIEKAGNEFSQQLLSVMKNVKKSAWSKCDNRTGHSHFWEYINSSVFVRNNYWRFCTVSTQALIVHRNGAAFFKEQRYKHDENYLKRLLAKPEEEAELPFILAFNRDEVTYRTSLPAHFLEDQGMDNIICGIDVQTNSTWLAFNKLTGNVCFLTNFRNPNNYSQKKKYSSRGFLVIDFVKLFDPTIKNKTFETLEEYEENLMSIETRGFNIIYGNVFTLKFKYYQYKNNPGQRMTAPIMLDNGRIYGLSNGGLDEWDKVQRGIRDFTSKSISADLECRQFKDTHDIQKYLPEFTKELFTLMKSDVKSAMGSVQRTGYPWYWEYNNSSIFIRNNLANFCTVSTTVLVVHKSGQVFYQEQRYNHASNLCAKLSGTLNFIRTRYVVNTDVKESFEINNQTAY